MKTAIFTLLTAILLFSCSTDERVINQNDTTNNSIITSRKGGTETPPIFAPYNYYTYTVKYNKTLSENKRIEIRNMYMGTFGIFTYQQTNIENTELWYTTLNPLAQEPSLSEETDDDDDFSVTFQN